MKAIYDQDLVEYLDNLGVLKSVEAGQAVCKICKTIISLDNLQAIFPDSGDIKFVCDKPNCMKSFVEDRS